MTALALRGLYLGAVTAYAGVVLIVSLALPDRAPLHFGPTGEADSYGSRGQVALMFVVIGVALVAVFAASGWLVRRGSTTWLNVPAKDWWTATPEREQTMRAMLAADLHAVGTATFLLLAAVVAMFGRAARDDAGLGAGFWVLVGLYLAAVLGWGVYSSRVRYRPTSE
ncbi:DUF1648 domain-containing protein [Nocardioides plantarum]|uniref:DUF1648 domain-containing protein n=1 Tax=Nocardioides plantarum TaxID=29299 RepID=A0ABV5KAE3_9ACTN|nr:DUF1648 domain-containing protein [Nocardioides plantarum]